VRVALDTDSMVNCSSNNIYFQGRNIAMNDNRNINFNLGGTYNESVHVQGDYVQGDKIQGDYVQGDKTIVQNFNQDIAAIQNLLTQFQKQYSTEEAISKTAQELAVNSANNPTKQKRLADTVKYIAKNGGIEAGIGKAVDLALKLLIGI
jgi:hypothetical protein